jgi:N-methylhydantoinase B
LGETILNPDTPTERKLHSKDLVAVAQGDVVSFRCSGSGGVGLPEKRPRDEVARDVREGLVTAEAARTVYKVEVTE